MKRSVFRVGATVAVAAIGAVGPLAGSALACGFGFHGHHEARHAPAHPVAHHPSKPTKPTSSVPLKPGPALPEHVSAPYIDVTSVASIAQASKDSGSKYLSLGFLQAPTPGSCDLTFAGDTTQSVKDGALADEIAKIRKAGGDVIPSLGGYAADTDTIAWANNPANLTEIADSCTDVHKIAQAYESVFVTYGVHRLDFDIESDSINNTPGVDRRNAAIAEVEQWAKKTHRDVQFSYTLPSAPTGLVANGLAVLQSAAAHHAVINNVNIMTFDYWDGATHDMDADARQAATALTGQLKATIAPHASQSELWSKVGVIQMNGIDDYGPTETFTVAQAKSFEKWAAQHHLAEISFWALERDHQGTVDDIGQTAGYDFSGVAQKDWDFSHAFAKFTSRDNHWF